MSHQALLLGVGDYPGGSNDLPATKKDLTFWKDHLVRYCKIPQSNLHLLLDAQASSANIREHWDKLAKLLYEGDRFYLVYSGHGDLLLNSEGKKEEALLLGDGPFFGSEFRKLSESLASKQQLFLLDCCFSGAFDLLPASRRPKSPGQPFDVAANQQIISQSSVTNDRDEFGNNLKGAIFFAACASGQLAASASSQTWGYSAFTYSLRFIREKAGSLNVDLKKLCQYSDLILKRLGYQQHPQLRGPEAGLNLKWLHHE